MNPIDLSVILYHTYNGAGYSGSGGGWVTSTTYVDPETVAAVADVATALL